MNETYKRIEELKKERSVVILAHVYQEKEVQEIADFTGDSLELSKKAIDIYADIIVFCGVRFMAETASILNPNKTVLLPEKAGCSLADMATVEKLKTKKKEYPNAAIVSYVNSSASIKAESDVCCTSANAVDVVLSLPQKQILFVPDKNLGKYVASKTNKKIILWNGFCYVHTDIKPEKIKQLKKEHRNATIMVHPECEPAVTSLADYVGSTTQMLKYAKNSNSKEYIIGTEDDFINKLKRENPNKRFYSVRTICKDMKLINLRGIVSALENMEYEVIIPENIRVKAKKALDRMLKVK